MGPLELSGIKSVFSRVQDLTAFYGIISGVNFTLLGLWWVAVQELKHLRQTGAGRMAYIVSLQFLLPGTAALLSQVAPKVTGLWRGSFTLAGVPSIDTAVAKSINGAQLEGVLFCLLVLISTQTAWGAAMSRWGEEAATYTPATLPNH
jgi:hypothetical protein